MIRVFPRKNKWIPTDDLAFVGDPPLFRPPEQPVRISITFTWDIPEGQRLLAFWSHFYSDVQLGGVAFGDPGSEFVPGRFVKSGVVFTSRGCNKSCSWCSVSQREGGIRELPITEGHIIQDNNLLACSDDHIIRVFDMLRRQRKSAVFSGGIDTTLLQPWHIALFKSIRVREIWLACDSENGLEPLRRAADLLRDFPQYKLRCFVMIGFDGESIAEAEQRIMEVYNLGFYPFSQLYQAEEKKQYSREWLRLNKLWSRPAAYKKYMRGE